MNQSYKDAGVDIEIGDIVSKMFYEAAKRTWNQRKGKIGDVIVPHDDFSGIRAIDISGLPEGSMMNIGFDGIGTKVEIAERVGDHSTMAYDLFAMVCDDAVMKNAEPVLVGSIFDVRSLTRQGGDYLREMAEIVKGYENAAFDAGVAILNGEVAELGDRVSGYTDFAYNWGSSVVWFASRDRMFTGMEIKPGDQILALKEHGFRSNGLSLARKVLFEKYGSKWHEQTIFGENIGRMVLHPSRIYSKAVVDMTGGFAAETRVEVHGVAHITGGGIPSKLGRILKPSGLGAQLDDLFDPPNIMKALQEYGEIPDSDAYKTWNMGQGMLIISPDPEGVISVAKEHNIEVKVVGEVTNTPKISIKSRGRDHAESVLEFALD